MGTEDDRSFVIPPPPPGTPVGPARPAERATSEVADRYITLPPGIVESATHRVDNPRIVRPPAPAVKTDDVVFFPAPPGVPVRSTTWRLVLSDGSVRELQRGAAVFIGRNPAALDDWPSGTLLVVDDPTKTLSKTHALLEIEGEDVFIHDLDSTNGVWLVPAEGALVRAEPGARTIVPPGAGISLGDYPLVIDRP